MPFSSWWWEVTMQEVRAGRKKTINQPSNCSQCQAGADWQTNSYFACLSSHLRSDSKILTISPNLMSLKLLWSAFTPMMSLKPLLRRRCPVLRLTHSPQLLFAVAQKTFLRVDQCLGTFLAECSSYKERSFDICPILDPCPLPSDEGMQPHCVCWPFQAWWRPTIGWH